MPACADGPGRWTAPTAISDSANTVASVSANLILTGILEAVGPVAGASVESTVTLSGALFDLRLTLDQAGNLSTSNDFVVDRGTGGPDH